MSYSFWSYTILPSPSLNGISSSITKLSATKLQPQIQSTSRDNNHIIDCNWNADDSDKFSVPFHVKSITSTTNPFVKHCVKLRQDSSYRHAHGAVLVVGTNPIREVCKFQEANEEIRDKVDCLFLHEKAEALGVLDGLSSHTVRVSAAVMKKLSRLQSTESVEAIALMKIPTSFLDLNNQSETDCRSWFPSPHRILVLDGIQDPGNLGTLLRSAVAFKWGGVFLLPGCCDPFNEKALRASRGASFQLPIVLGRWSHLEALKDEFQMKMLAGHPGSSGQESKPASMLSHGYADSLGDFPLCLVLGSEGGGLSEKSWQVSELVSIPMAGKFESLNVSVAGGIFLYMLQQRTCSHSLNTV